MTQMNINIISTYGGAWIVFPDEVQRLVELAEGGETLFYESEKGQRVTLENGTLLVEGFDCVSPLFAFYNRTRFCSFPVEFSNSKTRPLKALVKKIVISSGTRQLWNSFTDFPNLSEVVLPDTITSLINPFEECPNLKPYELPKNLQYIGRKIYGEYPSDVVLPQGIKDLNSAFKHSSIRTVTIPGSVTRIGMRDFAYCEELEKVVISEGVEIIDGEAFSDCVKLKDIVFPESLKEIGGYAFSDCSSLTSLKINPNCNVHPTAFYNTSVDYYLQIRRLLALKHIPYSESMGEICDYDSIKLVLEGKTLEEQFSWFTTNAKYEFEKSSYGESDGSVVRSKDSDCFPTSEIENLIVKDGIIVGVVIDHVNILVGTTKCTYYACEDDGAGCKERADYRSLFFKKANKG